MSAGELHGHKKKTVEQVAMFSSYVPKQIIFKLVKGFKAVCAQSPRLMLELEVSKSRNHRPYLNL